MDTNYVVKICTLFFALLVFGVAGGINGTSKTYAFENEPADRNNDNNSVGCDQAVSIQQSGEKKIPLSSMADLDENLLTKFQIENVKSKSADAVPIESLEKVADLHAKTLWGSEVIRGVPLQIIDSEGEPTLYAFPFAIKDSTIADTNGLIRQFIHLESNNDSSDPLYTEAARYGTIYVSARMRDYPVRRVTHSLHPYYYNIKRATLNVGADEIKNIKLRYLPPHEFFEIQKGDTTVRIHSHMLIDEKTINAASKKFVSPNAPAFEAENSGRTHTDQIVTAWKTYEEMAWDTILSPPTPRDNIEYKIRSWQQMPAIDWTRWCEPTAASMVFSFWDHYVPIPGIGGYPNYPRLVDYWYNHPSNGNNVPDILDPIADMMNIDVANNLKGYNWSVSKVIGDSNNDFGWNELVGHLHINHPLVWQVHGSMDHAVAAFGYRIINGQKYVILYNTWSDDPALAYEEWLYDDWNSVEVDRYLPGGKELFRQVIIKRPYGGETFTAGQYNQIRFHLHANTEIKKARIEYSLDGGINWGFVVELMVHPGWNSYYWVPQSTSNSARIRIRGMAEDRTYLGGHGSFKNFTIQ